MSDTNGTHDTDKHNTHNTHTQHTSAMSTPSNPPLRIAIIGAGPAGLTLALALLPSPSDASSSPPSLTVSLFERGPDHREAATYDPDRSYTIDITGHGRRSAERVGVTSRFDDGLIPFKGIRVPSLFIEERCPQPGWTGSRGDICRALLEELDYRINAMPGSHSASFTVKFGVAASVHDALKGELELRLEGAGASAPPTRSTFDLIVGCDGAGSPARRALQSQIPDFTVEGSELSNHSTMLALDLVGVGKEGGKHLDPSWLYVLSPPKVMMVAGAICGPGGKTDPLWFCQVGLPGSRSFTSPSEATTFLTKACPSITSLASPSAIEAFSTRKAQPTGKAKWCSSLHGGKVALLGDAGAPFPPVGQGVNAAMEAATVLAICLKEALSASPSEAVVGSALKLYGDRWGPEALAARTIAGGLDLSQSLSVVAKQFVYHHLGVSALTNAKDARITYGEALEKERRADRTIGMLGRVILAGAIISGVVVAIVKGLAN